MWSHKSPCVVDLVRGCEGWAVRVQRKTSDFSLGR